MKNSLEKWVTIFFMSASIFVSVLLVESIVLALLNEFKTLFIYFSLIPAFVIAMLFSTHLKRDVKFLPKITVPIMLLIFLVSLILIFYPHDTFGGRDESIYTNLAVYLTSNSSFKIPSYLNNLPYNLAEGTREWHKGYPVWLGTQEILFGIRWMLRSNMIIIILGLSSFFLVSSYLGGGKIGLIVTVLFSSSMPFLWFSRETMSENLSFFLLWTIILFLLFFLKTKNHTYLIPVFICSWLFGLTRYEGFLLQFVFFIVLSSLLFLNKTSLKKIIVIITIYILVLISNIYIAKDIFLPTFFKTYVPSVSFSIKKDLSTLVPKNLLNNNIEYSTTGTSNQRKFDNLTLFIFLMLAKYNFILVIFSIFLITFQFLIRIKKLDKSKKFFFIILILLIPEYYKLISPNVTIDQPWLYRRYMYALLPLGYLCLTILLSQLKNKKLLVILLSSLFMINIILSSPILFLKNNWMLVSKLDQITKDISRNDFIIVEKSPLGYYSPSSFLIINNGIRSAASSILWLQYFFPEKKLFNGVPYNKIFLLSAEVHSSFDIVSKKVANMLISSSFDIVSRKSVDVEYVQLIPSCQLYILGDEEGLADSYNIRELSFLSVEKYCSQPKNEIAKHKEKLYLYELIYKNEKN